MVAGITAFSGVQDKPVGASGEAFRPPGHRPGANRSTRLRPRWQQSGQDAVQPRLRTANDAVMDHLLLQPDEPVPVRLLAARSPAFERVDAGAGGLRHHPLPAGRHMRGPLPWCADRPFRSGAGARFALRHRRRIHRVDCPRQDAVRTAARGSLPCRADDHWQPGWRHRDLRQALSGAHAHQRPAWSGGVGRTGSIVAPILGGYLLSIGLPPTRIFLSACLVALVAATATALLALRGAPDSAIRPEPVP
jgi:hypothetical protein